MKKCTINTSRILVCVLLVALAGRGMRKADGSENGRWLAGDFHNHTFLTDGGKTAAEVFAHAFGFGLDWIANSEHGGAFARNPEGQPWPAGVELEGTPPEGRMWRWQSLWRYSFPIVAKTRLDFPGKLIVQGYEWNVPAHDHASVAIVGPAEAEGLAIARHEYLFDQDDSDTTAGSRLGVDGKNADNNHDKAVAGVKWLADNYPESSYFLINHPSRMLKYSIAAIRDFNNAAPTVAFGFEGMPGHQKATGRGGYSAGPFPDDSGRDVTFKARTYGGADFMLAKVGGPWDALLGEGRRFFVFVNSDFHGPANDFWPGEYAKIHTFARDENRDGNYHFDELLDGLRSGNSFVAHGDLIDGLQVTAQCLPPKTFWNFLTQREPGKAEMGGVLDGDAGCDLRLTIRFRSPAKNNSGAAAVVDHIDLIAGEVRGKVARYLEDGMTPNPDYDKDGNETTRVVATFTAKDWQDGREGGGKDGWRIINHHLGRVVERDMYFRLRGTNLGLGVANETDTQGNPLSDDLMAPNTTNKAYADLWFYSNPVFVRVAR